MDFEDPDEDITFFDCLNPVGEISDDSDDDWAGIPFEIKLPDEFVSAHFNELHSGTSHICIPGGEAIRSFNGTSRDVIIFPEDSHITVTLGGSIDPDEELGLGLGLGSPKRVLVIRVLGDSGAEEPTETQDILAGAVFGIGNQPFTNSMKAQLERCSFGHMEIVPASGYPQISNGVVEVSLSESMKGQNMNSLRSGLLQRATQDAIGVDSLESVADHLMFCMASGTHLQGREWSAFATVRGSVTFFQSGRCDKLSALVHEFAHNLGLIHSSELNSQYGDTTGAVRYQKLSCCNTFCQAHLL